jgi:hypothetical protein
MYCLVNLFVISIVGENNTNKIVTNFCLVQENIPLQFVQHESYYINSLLNEYYFPENMYLHLSGIP